MDCKRCFDRIRPIHQQSLTLRTGDDDSHFIPAATIVAVNGDGPETRIVHIAEPDSAASRLEVLSVGSAPPEVCNRYPSPRTANIHRILSGHVHDITVIVSVASGSSSAATIWKTAISPALHELAVLNEANHRIHFTISRSSITEITRKFILPRALSLQHQLVILLSGDGGVHDLVNALATGTRDAPFMKPLVALLPFGTGNALAASSGIATGSTFGLRALLGGTPVELPSFRVVFSSGAKVVDDSATGETASLTEDPVTRQPTIRGIVVCSWGLHATLVADSDTPAYRAFGSERFQMAAKEALFPSDGGSPHAYRGRILFQRQTAVGDSQSDQWQPIDRSTHGYLLATLVRQLESTFTISPHSRRPWDRSLRVIYFGDLTGPETMTLLTEAYNEGQHVQDQRVEYEEVQALRVEFEEKGEDSERWRRICVDGRIVVVEEGGWMEVAMAKDEENVADDEGLVDVLVPG